MSRAIGSKESPSTPFPKTNKAPSRPKFGTRQALFSIFFLSGFLYAAWIVRTPAIRDGLGLTLGEMGWVLFGLSAGAMIGLLFTAKLVNAYGPQRMIALGTLVTIIGLLAAALPLLIALPVPGAFAAWFGLALVGLGSIFLDISVNVAGAALEASEKRPFLTTLHGGFSFGEAVGAFFGFGCVAVGLDPMTHFAAACVLMLPLIVLSFKPLDEADKLLKRLAAAKTQEASASADASAGSGTASNSSLKAPKKKLRIDALLATAVAVVFSVALCEGTANDWLPILLGETLGASGSFSAFAFALFASGLAAVRFTGVYWLGRFGRMRVLCGSAVMALLGLLIVILIKIPAFVIAGVVLWSAGTALGYPVALSAGAASGGANAAGSSAERMSVLSTAGYGAFLVGPPLLGFIADHFGLPFALGFAALFLAFPIAFAKRLTAKTDD